MQPFLNGSYTQHFKHVTVNVLVALWMFFLSQKVYLRWIFKNGCVTCVRYSLQHVLNWIFSVMLIMTEEGYVFTYFLFTLFWICYIYTQFLIQGSRKGSVIGCYSTNRVELLKAMPEIVFYAQPTIVEGHYVFWSVHMFRLSVCPASE